MRHRKLRTKLNRTSEHHLALMRSLSKALITHDRIQTTETKAKQLRRFVEPLVTLARRGDLHSRRMAFARLGGNDKHSVHRLFEEIGPRVGDRPGGYTRVIKDGPRAGDGAMMAYIEFVDRPEVSSGDQPADLESRLKKRAHERRKEMKKARR